MMTQSNNFQLFKEINNLIDNNELLYATKKLKDLNIEELDRNDKEIFKFLKGKINEKEINTYDIQEDLEYGKHYLSIKKYTNALFYFRNGLLKSGASIFDYYIGKTYFKMGTSYEHKKYYYVSYDYFKRYASIGGEKLSKAYYYLASLYFWNIKKPEKSKQAIDFSENIARICGDEESVIPFKNKLYKLVEEKNERKLQKLMKLKRGE